jgi:hypothetical protein
MKSTNRLILVGRQGRLCHDRTAVLSCWRVRTIRTGDDAPSDAGASVQGSVAGMGRGTLLWRGLDDEHQGACTTVRGRLPGVVGHAFHHGVIGPLLAGHSLCRRAWCGSTGWLG